MLREILERLATTARRTTPEEINPSFFEKEILLTLADKPPYINGKTGNPKVCWHKEQKCYLRRKDNICSLTDGPWKNVCGFDISDFSATRDLPTMQKALDIAKAIMTFNRRKRQTRSTTPCPR